MSEAKEAEKRRVGRSPAYPYIPVQKALEQASALHRKEGDYLAPLPSAVAAWGYSPKSSGGRQTLATLKYYGLIDVVGDGDSRKIKVSDIARRIILDKREDETEKRRLIRSVGLSPSAHKALYEEYPNGLASDRTVEHFLIFDRGFNSEAAKELLTEFKETARYIQLYELAAEADKPEDIRDEEEAKPLSEIQIGDRVQCAIQGVDQWADGALVVGFSDDGEWVFTDKSSAGAPRKDITVLKSAAAARDHATPPSRPAHMAGDAKVVDQLKPGMRKAIFPIGGGDVSLIFPEDITADGLEELGLYLDIFLKKEAKKKS